jgi:hypothetical protein
MKMPRKTKKAILGKGSPGYKVYSTEEEAYRAAFEYSINKFLKDV